MPLSKKELAYYKKWRENNKDRVLKYVNKWKLKNPDKVKQHSWNNYHNNRNKRLKYQKEWYQKNKERMLERVRKRKNKNPALFIFRNVRARAKKRKIKFNLSIKDIVVPKYCPILGTKLKWGTKHAHANSPSLDKIIPSKGYTKGNVVVISHRANCIKGDASLEELKKVVNFYSSFI